MERPAPAEPPHPGASPGPPADPSHSPTPASFAALWRRTTAPLDRATALLLLQAAVMPVIYVYQGQPAFYRAHLATAGDALAPVKAQIWRFSSVFVLFFAIPALLHRGVARRPLAELGLTRSRWPLATPLCLASLALAAPLLWLSAADPAFQAEYPLAPEAAASSGRFALYLLSYALYYWGWEFFFRGALQLGLCRRLGPLAALMVQLLPSVLLHIGKPAGETWGALLAAPLLGAVALRGGAVLPLFLFHYGLGVLNDLFCAARAGIWP